MRFLVDSHPTRRTSPTPGRPAERHQPHETQHLARAPAGEGRLSSSHGCSGFSELAERAAVDRPLRASDLLRPWREQVGDDSGDVLGLADPADGQATFLADEPIDRRVGVGAEPRGKVLGEPARRIEQGGSGGPGETTFERIPIGPNSMASDFDNDRIAALDAA